MGYRPQPKDPEFCDNCSLCFPAGKTPERLIASFSGIEPCDFYDHDKFGAIPSSIELVNSGYCRWEGEIPPHWYCFYESSALQSKLWLSAGHTDVAFHGEVPSPCVFGFSNKATCAEPWLYLAKGGNGSVVWRANVGSSVQAVCGAIGIPVDLITKFDVIPIDATHNLFHFYRAGQMKDLLIKVDMAAL